MNVHDSSSDELFLDDELAEDAQFVSQATPELQTHQLAVPFELSASRLDKMLVVTYPSVSRTRIKTLIEEGAVTVDGQVCNVPRYVVVAGQQVVFEERPSEAQLAFHPEEMTLDILYEDDHILIINKPAGLVVHPGAGNWTGTLLNGLLAYDEELAKLPRAGLVHRLDAWTSGLMVVARSRAAYKRLVDDLREHRVVREYWALAHGQLHVPKTIHNHLMRDPHNPLRFAISRMDVGKHAITHVTPIDCQQINGLWISWVSCKLETGRTHQIRVHMESIAMPLVNDNVYRGSGRSVFCPEGWVLGRQALHAYHLELQHPITEESLSFNVDPPQDMDQWMTQIGWVPEAREELLIAAHEEVDDSSSDDDFDDGDEW